ncbi:MAG: DNA mismatch repair protein MutS [Puia sp.]|nr:DNA mismatch repair protein MutS [Puia sp.]
MDIDKTTYEDLSLFSHEEEYSIFHKLDCTRTRGGRDCLLELFNEPFGRIAPIRETQQILAQILRDADQWPLSISNGTIMVMEKFYETAIDEIPPQSVFPYTHIYRIFHAPDYSLVRYSVGHFADFVRGMGKLAKLLDREDSPERLRTLMSRVARLLEPDPIRSLAETEPGRKPTPSEALYYGHFLRNRFRTATHELIKIYGQLDAWYSMAMANRKYGLCFPEFLDRAEPTIETRGLFHILLPKPVAYDVELDQRHNFMFLTGANMGGKSTFIKAVGTAVFLAHLGMGVPAVAMRLSLFEGILSNINVVDNIVKGESYFFNEVQRIRNTLLKISDRQRWLVLIDELFKGTNVQDAMKCSSTVIKGLIRIPSSLFILSTHLYEIGDELRQYPNIVFSYFETRVREDDELEFSYQLKEGISNDRLGYLILKREKVVEMLEKL